MDYSYFLFQNCGVNMSRIGKISSLPRSIATESTIFENTEYAEKFDAGPTPARPGPTLLKQADIAVKFVSKSKGSKESNSRNTRNSIKYTAK